MSDTISRVRLSIHELQLLYDNGYKKPLEDVVRALHGVQTADPDSIYSFFYVGGLHGQPFNIRPPTDRNYWGGYCHHGNILFPTWHRAQLFLLEEGMRKIPGCENVTLPFFDATHPEVLKGGLPKCVTDSIFVLDGKEIPNPLMSYKFQKAVADDMPDPDDMDYSKPVGYRTVRYPYSGMVANEEDRKESEEHNAKFTTEKGIEYLNDNFRAWMFGGNPDQLEIDQVDDYTPQPTADGTFFKFLQCLKAPNYTAFSNKNSQESYNEQNKGTVWSLEDAHNDIHLAIGGKTFVNSAGQEVIRGQIEDANGDMGVNNTAGFDPFFYFHHCNVDRLFWIWQVRNGKTDDLGDIDYRLAGTTTKEGDSLPPTGVGFDEDLTLDSPLIPFYDENNKYMTSRDVTNCHKMGYRYGAGSLDMAANLKHMELLPRDRIPVGGKKLRVFKISRLRFKGSFTIYVYVKIKGVWEKLGHDAVLDGSNPVKCKNCMKHEMRGPSLPLTQQMIDVWERRGDFKVRVEVSGVVRKKTRHFKLDDDQFHWEVIE